MGCRQGGLAEEENAAVSGVLLFTTMCIVGLLVDVHVKDSFVYSGIFHTACVDDNYAPPSALSSLWQFTAFRILAIVEVLYQFSYATEPEHELKKRKLDLRGKDEADASYTSESNDDDFGTGNLEPQHFNTEIFFKLCKAAIAYYQDEHPEAFYEFESIQAVSCTIGVVDGYGIVFCAKNMRIDGNPLQTFNAGVAYFAQTEPDKHRILKCAQLKDEVEEIWDDECYCREVLLKDIKENEYKDIVHLCKLTLGYYQDGHPGE